MIRTPTILAVSEHTGWAHIVCVSARDRRPVVVARRRIALIDRGLPMQPYEHGTQAMRPEEAEALVAAVRKSVTKTTTLALQRIVGELPRESLASALSIRTPPFDKLPATVADAHASYRLLCAADGVLYNLAIRAAAKRLGLDVELCRRGEETDRAAAALGVTPNAVEDFVSGAGRPPGPPWTTEHRRAYAAAIATLTLRVRGLTIA